MEWEAWDFLSLDATENLQRCFITRAVLAITFSYAKNNTTSLMRGLAEQLYRTNCQCQSLLIRIPGITNELATGIVILSIIAPQKTIAPIPNNCCLLKSTLWSTGQRFTNKLRSAVSFSPQAIWAIVPSHRLPNSLQFIYMASLPLANNHRSSKYSQCNLSQSICN